MTPASPPDGAILLFGASGQVGGALLERLRSSARIVAPTRAEADFAEPARPAALVRDIAPRLIIIAAAYTAVDAAEDDRAVVFRVNCDAPAAIAREAKRCGAPLIHYSTDYVFDGETKRPWRESDPPRPINVYGESKRAGEEAVAATGADYIILRTSWVYANRGQNFLTTIRRLAGERDEIWIVDDQIGSPTWAGALAEATETLIAELAPQGSRDLEKLWGLYHCSAAGRTSWYGFAQAIMARIAGPKPGMIPVPTSGYPTPARRPRFSVLDNSLIHQRLGIGMATWESQLAACLSRAE